MDVRQPWPLLGGLTPRQFMRRHWQRAPLLVRQAWPGVAAPVTRQQLFALAARDDVESRLVLREPSGGRGWRLRHGPHPRRALPPLRRPGWTLLVQDLDQHSERAHAMLSCFRFVSDARLDDLMLSYATDGGGVGAHIDSYDVFLLQVHGRRRWRIAPAADDRCIEGLPLRILRHFEPQQEWVLEPGDMLYLPPRWGHDGIAVGECMTCSIGFRAPSSTALASELLGRIAEQDDPREVPYRDAHEAATDQPARIPVRLQAFARKAVHSRLQRARSLARALGEMLTEPKPQLWFEARGTLEEGQAVRLDRRSRMMYDDEHVFINGESCRAAGRDARLMAHLADARQLSAGEVRRLSPAAWQVLAEWVSQGWVHGRVADDA